MELCLLLVDGKESASSMLTPGAVQPSWEQQDCTGVSGLRIFSGSSWRGLDELLAPEHSDSGHLVCSRWCFMPAVFVLSSLAYSLAEQRWCRNYWFLWRPFIILRFVPGWFCPQSCCNRKITLHFWLPSIFFFFLWVQLFSSKVNHWKSKLLMQKTQEQSSENIHTIGNFFFW